MSGRTNPTISVLLSLLPINNHPNSQMRADLNVPFAEKNQAKAGGAIFDRTSKVWFVCNPPAYENCRQWLDDPAAPCPAMLPERDWVHITYDNRESAKRQGMRFDGDAKCWYRP